MARIEDDLVVKSVLISLFLVAVIVGLFIVADSLAFIGPSLPAIITAIIITSLVGVALDSNNGTEE